MNMITNKYKMQELQKQHALHCVINQPAGAATANSHRLGDCGNQKLFSLVSHGGWKCERKAWEGFLPSEAPCQAREGALPCLQCSPSAGDLCSHSSFPEDSRLATLLRLHRLFLSTFKYTLSLTHARLILQCLNIEGQNPAHNVVLASFYILLYINIMCLYFIFNLLLI